MSRSLFARCAALSLVSSGIFMLAGCGTRGPLVLPPQAPAETAKPAVDNNKATPNTAPISK